jgi:hypothetical protein
MTPEIKVIDLLPFASSDSSFMMATAAALVLTAPMLLTFYSLRNLLPATSIFIVFWAFMMSGLNVYIFAVGPAVVFGCLSAVLFNGLRGRTFSKQSSEERLEELKADREAFGFVEA